MTLFLSGYHGGPNVEFTMAAKASRGIASILHSLHDSFVSPGAASLDIVFEYPGTISRPTFEGIKQGKHSNKKRMTQVWVAVPERLLNSAEFADFYFESVEKALEHAKRKFEASKIAFPLEEYKSLAQELAKRYRDQTPLGQ